MSIRTTGVLLAVLLILSGAVYYLMQSPAPSTQSTATKVPTVVTFTPGDATKLIIAGGGKTTEIGKLGTSWALTTSPGGTADNTRVQGWIDQIGNLNADRAIDGVTDFGTYGLTQPSLTVDIDLQGGAAVKLQFGSKTPDGGDYYVKIASDATKSSSVYLIGASLGDDLNSALTKPPVALPTPTPFPTFVPATIVAPPGTPLTTVTPGG